MANTNGTHREERQQLVEVTQLLVERKALSLSLHGNLSMRLDGDRVLVSGSSLAGLRAEVLARLPGGHPG
jgi:hypothetical protein